MNLPVVLAVLIGTLVLACSSAAPAPTEPTPNIDATVEARAKEMVASQATPTPYPTYTQAPKPTNTPAPQRINTLEPAPTNTPTLVPSPTSVPTPTPRPLPTATPWTAKQLDSEFKTNPMSEPSVGFNCPKSVEPTYSVRLVNLSEIDDTAVTDCFNFAISHISNVDTQTMLIIYPVGPFVGPEVTGNDTHYRGSAFTPVISKDQRDLITDQIEDYLTPACGSQAAEIEAWHLARFAELGGGQQAASKAAVTGECSTKRWIVISIDPERALMGRELLFTFFHEIFHTVQSGGHPPCTYSASAEDSFWLTEAGASYFGWEITAEVERIEPTLVWYQWMNFISERLEIEEWGPELGDPGIAEKGAVALYLLRQRGVVNHADIINGSLFQGCSGHLDVFSKDAMRIARDYWSDYMVLDKSIVFSDHALNR